MLKVDGLLDWLVPRVCLLCGQRCAGTAVCCPGCHDDLPWLVAADRPGGNASPAGRVLAALAYEYPVDRLVSGAKFRRQLHYARALGELLAEALLHRHRAGALAMPQLIVPVPLHRRRLGQRGYNQALEIARPVACRLGLPLAPRLCRRLRNTRQQAGLKAAERRRNVRRAFVAGGEARGVRIAILDDVITTGSTVAAVAAALRKAGAAELQVWAVARAL